VGTGKTRIVGGAIRQQITIFFRVEMQGRAGLAEIIETLYPPDPLLGGRQRREEERSQYADDGDDRQQFDQRESGKSGPPDAVMSFRFH
jgi:hypothetical protein